MGALIGAVLFGFMSTASRSLAAMTPTSRPPLEAIPGALIGMGLVYLEGMRRERAHQQSTLGLS